MMTILSTKSDNGGTRTTTYSGDDKDKTKRKHCRPDAAGGTIELYLNEDISKGVHETPILRAEEFQQCTRLEHSMCTSVRTFKRFGTVGW